MMFIISCLTLLKKYMVALKGHSCPLAPLRKGEKGRLPMRSPLSHVPDVGVKEQRTKELSLWNFVGAKQSINANSLMPIFYAIFLERWASQQNQ